MRSLVLLACGVLVSVALVGLGGCQPRNRLGNRELGQSSLTNGRSVFTGNPNAPPPPPAPAPPP